MLLRLVVVVNLCFLHQGAAGQQRIAVELNGIGYVLTAYIPSDFMEKIEDGMIEQG